MPSTADDALRLDVCRLIREGEIRPGARTLRRLEWRDGATGALLASLCMEADLRTAGAELVRLRFVADGTARTQVVRLVTTRTSFGARRWWWCCPISRRRARILLLVPGGPAFASRTALGLTYRSQRLGPTDRVIARARLLRRSLGISDTDLLVMPRTIRRPSGMRRAKYHAILAEIEAATTAIRQHYG